VSEKEIIFEEYKASDHDAFVACINDFYRGGYPYPQYLDKNDIQELLASGDLIITVARCDGKIVGTSAAQRLRGMFEGSVLLLLRSVLEEMQRKGIGTRQEYYLLSLVRERFPEALSLYADVMTHSSASQKTMLRQGFVLCGLRLMLYKNELIVPKLNYGIGTKMTQAVYCKSTGEGSVMLFAPEEHREFIAGIYGALGTKCAFVEGDRDTGVSFSVKDKAVHQSIELKVDNGTQALDELCDTLNAYFDKGYTAVVYLNMLNPNCETVYRRLTEMNFYFSGVKPLSEKGEYLLMAQTDNCVNSFEDIQLPEEEKEILNYILRRRNIWKK